MIVRDAYAALNGSTETLRIDSMLGLELLDESGRVLFSIEQSADGSLGIRAPGVVDINGRIHSDRIAIRPRASNAVVVCREIL